MKTKIGITEKSNETVSYELAKLLADEVVLATKTRNAHWNLEGPDFYSKHKFFEDQYKAIDDMVDEVAERIRTLGHYVGATLKGFLELTQLTETSREANDSSGFIKEILADHEAVIIRLREHIDQIASDSKDLGTSDFITGLMETHEKMAWMLRSHLKS